MSSHAFAVNAEKPDPCHHNSDDMVPEKGEHVQQKFPEKFERELLLNPLHYCLQVSGLETENEQVLHECSTWLSSLGTASPSARLNRS